MKITQLKNWCSEKNTRTVQRGLDQELSIFTQHYAYKKCLQVHIESFGTNYQVVGQFFKKKLTGKCESNWLLQSEGLEGTETPPISSYLRKTWSQLKTKHSSQFSSY